MKKLKEKHLHVADEKLCIISDYLGLDDCGRCLTEDRGTQVLVLFTVLVIVTIVINSAKSSSRKSQQATSFIFTQPNTTVSEKVTLNGSNILSAAQGNICNKQTDTTIII